MSQIILDEQLGASELVVPLQKWFKVRRLKDILPHQTILDDRIPQILLSLSSPTFLTIDRDFWDRRLCNPGYGILYFAIPDFRQEELAISLKKLLRLRRFRSKVARAGKVIRVSATKIEFWEFQKNRLHRMPWKRPGRQPSE